MIRVDDSAFRFWVQTCQGRKDGPSLKRTMASLDASDIAGRYEVIEAPLSSPKVCNAWWKQTLLRLAIEPVNGVVPTYLVRLEDDVVVNRHIGFNVATWDAYQEEDFGMGLLFNWDGQWPVHMPGQRWTRRGNLCRLDLNICGAQGQIFACGHIPDLVSAIDGAQKWGLANELCFDWVATRACRLAGRYVYSHLPSLVNCHELCTPSASGYEHQGHFSSKTFDPNWKRQEGVADPRY